MVSMSSLEAAIDAILEHHFAEKHSRFIRMLCRIATSCRALQQAVTRFQALERGIELTWLDARVDDDTVLAVSRAYPNLTSIGLSNGLGTSITHVSMQIIVTAYPQLETFRLSAGTPGFSGAVALARGCSQLKKLVWNGENCSQLNASVVALATGLTHLTHVTLCDGVNNQLSADAVVALGLACPGLQELRLSFCHIKDDAFVHPWPSLEALDVECTAVRGEIPKGTFPRLRQLDCTSCHSLDSTAVLEWLSDLPRLDCLCLEDSCTVDDAFVRAMTLSVPGLRGLSLGHDDNDGRSRFMTEESASQLTRNLPELRMLQVPGCGTAVGDVIVGAAAQPGSNLAALYLGKASNAALDRMRSRAKHCPALQYVRVNGVVAWAVHETEDKRGLCGRGE